MVMWIMSDRTIPRSLRMIEGFGVHSFRLLNENGESTFVKFHWRPKLGLQSTIWDEAVKIAGADPDFHRRDMFEQSSRRLSGVGAGGTVVHAGRGRPVPLRSPRCHQADSGRIGATASNRTHGAGSVAGQFFRRNGTGRFLPGEHRTRHRFLERPAVAGAPVSYIDTQLSRLGSANFNQIRSTRPSARSPIISVMVTCRWRSRRAASRMSRTHYRQTLRAKRRRAAFPAHR